MVVRRDLPLGDQFAQTVHAAGESLPGRAPPNTYAVVLAARDETELLVIDVCLRTAGFEPVLIREPDLQDQATALGIFVEDRSKLRKLLARLPLMR